MSDGISEARKGTYFSDRSHEYDEKEEIKKRIYRVRSIIQDYNFELDELKNRLEKLENTKKIT